MTELLFKSYELTRNNFIKRVQNLNPAIIDTKPQGFNNNIHWLVGHVLTVAEQFMFGFTGNANLPGNYKDLFGNGTNPGDWKEEIPSLEVLIDGLKEQIERIKQIPNEQFAEKLPKPFLSFETYGELTNMAIFHEANHLGQIQTMARLIEA